LYDTHAYGFESLLVGLLGDAAERVDRFASDAIRSHLFATPGQPGSGNDLIAVDIMRGRDHGINPYHVYRYVLVGKISR
jgi:hypothetical protein